MRGLKNEGTAEQLNYGFPCFTIETTKNKSFHGAQTWNFALQTVDFLSPFYKEIADQVSGSIWMA